MPQTTEGGLQPTHQPIDTRHIDQKKHKQIAVQTMKEFSEVKQFMKQWKKNLDELV